MYASNPYIFLPIGLALLLFMGNTIMSDLSASLQAGLAQMQCPLPDEQQQLLLQYMALLKKWNSTYNLTALRDERKMMSHHLLDSLTLLPYVANVKTMIDVGSGGGMPGIPTAICRPDLQITLLDANTKKTTFLQQAVIELGLKNVRVISGRVEALQNQTFDVVTSRAFAELSDFVALTRQLLQAKTGYWAAMKGVRPDDEIQRLPADIDVYQIDELFVPTLDAQRHMVLMKPQIQAA